jgi:hypothetical protein
MSACLACKKYRSAKTRAYNKYRRMYTDHTTVDQATLDHRMLLLGFRPNQNICDACFKREDDNRQARLDLVNTVVDVVIKMATVDKDEEVISFLKDNKHYINSMTPAALMWRIYNLLMPTYRMLSPECVDRALMNLNESKAQGVFVDC